MTGVPLRSMLALVAVTIILAITLGASSTLSTCAALLTGPTNRGLRDCTSATSVLQRSIDDGADRLDGLLGGVQGWRR